MPMLSDYGNNTCSSRLMHDSEEKLANALFIVEYNEKKEKPLSRIYNENLEPLIVGGHNGENNSFVSSVYGELHLYIVHIPERDFLVGAIYHPPWLSWETNVETGDLIFQGYLYEILNHLSQKMGFTYQILPEYDFAGDLMLVDDVEKHMYTLFANNTVDFFLHANSVRGQRLGKSGVVSLTTSFQRPSMYLLTKRVEKTESVSIWQFMLPFREESWIIFWSSYIVVSLLMAYYNKKNPNEYQAIAHTFGPNSSPSDHLGLLNSLWFNFAPICAQGVGLVPQSTACTVLTGTWWLFLLLVISAYTANMTAFMTQVNSGDIETLDALANQKEMEYGILGTSAMYRLFLPQAKEAPYTTMWEYFQRNTKARVFQTQADAFAKVMDGNFYLVADFESAVYAMATSCEYDVKGDGFYQYQFSLPFPAGSVYLPIFNDYIRKLEDSGTLSELEKKWFTIEKDCEVVITEQSLENQLDLKAFIGMYAFLGFGVGGGLIVCLFETGWVKCGGISGFFGRAGIYELDADRKEIQRANDLLEKEFESWEGGWDVWKFKEWKPGDEQVYAETNNPKPKLKQNKCEVCGRGLTTRRKPSDTAINHALMNTPMIVIETSKADEENTDSGRESASSNQLKNQEIDKKDAGNLVNEQSNESKQVVTEEIKQEDVKNGVNNDEKENRNHSKLSDTDVNEIPEAKQAPNIQEVPKEEKRMKKPLHHDILNNKKEIQKFMAITKPTFDLTPPSFSSKPTKIPLEYQSSDTEERRLNSSLSETSTFSHSSLASGTLSFITESDDSVSTIHPRTPFELSPTPLSSYYAKSNLSRDNQSSFRSGTTSFYSTTSYEPESGYSRQSSRSRTMLETPISYATDMTEDARSDVTVISRRVKREQF